MSRPLDLDAVAQRLLAKHGLPTGRAVVLGRTLRTLPRTELLDGEIVCEQGEPAGTLGILTRGRFEVRINRVSGARALVDGSGTPVAELQAPALFGHMSMIDGAERSATCVALGRAQILSVSADRFRRLVDASGAEAEVFRMLLWACMFDQLAAGTSQIRDLLRTGPLQPTDVTSG